MENAFARWDLPTILVKFALLAMIFPMASSSTDTAQSVPKT